MFNSYHQLELCRKNIWHEGCHKTLANFKSVAYVHNRCRSEYSILLSGIDAHMPQYCNVSSNVTHVISYFQHDYSIIINEWLINITIIQYILWHDCINMGGSFADNPLSPATANAGILRSYLFVSQHSVYCIIHKLLTLKFSIVYGFINKPFCLR